jgi:hypothetical protein
MLSSKADSIFQNRGVLSTIVLAEGVESFDAVDERAVLADLHEGKRRGVKGSPHFYCGNFDAFCPSLDISRSKDGELMVSVPKTSSGLVTWTNVLRLGNLPSMIGLRIRRIPLQVIPVQ